MKGTELKPCPFCGGKAKINVRQSGFHGQNFEGNKKLSWTIYVKCNKCHARGKPIKTEPIKLYADHSHIEIGSFYATEFWKGNGRGLMTATLTFEPYVDDAIEAWNRRADK
jgi:Lar family restriction alleviation protein